MRSIIQAAGSVSLASQTFPRSNCPVGKILNFEFHPIPGIGFPGEGHRDGALDFRLPRFEVQHLTVAIKNQRITLSDHAAIALLTPFLRGIDVGFDRVVRKIRWAEISPSAA